MFVSPGMKNEPVALCNAAPQPMENTRDVDRAVQLWYNEGQLHRDNDQPAVMFVNGRQEWFQHGQRHRDNGLPAVIYADGTQEWWEHGRHMG